jgi:hypothetical protein
VASCYGEPALRRNVVLDVAYHPRVS